MYLGDSARQLYGVYHAPAAPGRGTSGVLLCYPGIQEYNAAHWAFRRLAAMLARDGHHVLRFDYTGTGDSAGEVEQGSPAIWQQDIEQAAAELRDISGARRLSIVGMRIGATLASLACQKMLEARRLLLWEPVVRGETYVRELESWDKRRNLLLLHAVRSRGRRDELLGHPFSTSLRQELESLDLCREGAPRAERVSILVSEERSDYQSLRASLDRAGLTTSLRVVKEAASSSGADAADKPMLSSAVLIAISQELRDELVA
ncbi:MAG TPA: alpha/beta hydrolase [Polyangiaceae bacterium]|jgi:pimeloyl-ACP methyl ester carboxylesterase